MTTQETLDEVQRFKEFCKEFDYDLDDKMMIQEISSHTIPNQEFTQ